MEAPRIPRPWPLGPRGVLLAGLVSAAVGAHLYLGLSWADLVPRGTGAQVCGDFFAAALRPAWTYEADFVPPGSAPFLLRLGEALLRTIVFASVGMTLALGMAVPLGFLASDAWWEDTRGGEDSRTGRGRLVQGLVRAVMAGMRSIHELLWALLFLAAFGLNTFSAVAALALPFGGTLAKVFAELIDETGGESSAALRAAGGGGLALFLFGRLPGALADMASYAFYRFECAIRSSAILGFFGYPTLGYYLHRSFENLHYREVWTYLYALALLVLALEAWSAALRRRFVA